MTINSQELLADLKSRTTTILQALEKDLTPLSFQQLNWKPAPDSWSILECLQHLNLYGEFYIPEIGKAINRHQASNSQELFKSGLLGNYFAKSMLPKNGVVTNKMKTFKDKVPAQSDLKLEVLQTFKKQQEQFLDLLNQAEKINISKAKTPITISNLIKLKLGDTFRFVIYHHQRHMVQIEGLLKQMPESLLEEV